MYRTHRCSGLTLIELTVVLVILAIATVTALVSAAVSSTTFNAAVQTVASDITYAQSHAVAGRRRIYVVFTPGNSSVADKYELQCPLGTLMARAGGNSGTVTMGRANTTLPGAKLNFGTALTIGFDSTGQPFIRSNGTDTMIVSVNSINLRDATGRIGTVSVQPFTGEITIP